MGVVERKLYIKRDSGIILALDITVRKQARDLVRLVCDYIDAVKVGYPLVLSTKMDVVRELKSICKLPIIADFKVADIPPISRRIVRIAINGGCDGIFVHGFMGPDGVKASIDEAKEKMVFVVTELTSPGGLVFTQPVAEDVAKMAKQLGAYGIQTPGTRPERIGKLRQVVGKDLVIVSCGIGAQGPKPGTAIRAGADFEIIGRAIYESSNPELATRRIRKLIEQAILEKETF